jgi:trigger factor
MTLAISLEGESQENGRQGCGRHQPGCGSTVEQPAGDEPEEEGDEAADNCADEAGRRHADDAGEPIERAEQGQLQRPDLQRPVGERVRPVARIEAVGGMDEIREVGGVAGRYERTDGYGSEQCNGEGNRRRASHLAEIGGDQRFLERKPSPTAYWQNGRTLNTKVEELPESRVRLEVEVPVADVKHAVEHAASDLAETTKIPGFRKGKVPREVLMARLGRDRVFKEGIETHIGGWFLNAAADARIRPVAQPQLTYDLPTSEDESFNFTAEVPVQQLPDVADWSEVEVPAAEAEVPDELIERELEALRASVAELVAVEGRPAKDGDVLVIDLVDDSGEAQRDYVVQLGAGRLLEELERALRGMSAGESKTVAFKGPDGSERTAEVAVKELKEPILPPLDDDLAKATSEFETLAELRGEIESRLRELVEAELSAEFRSNAVDRLAAASNVQVADSLVDARANDLLAGLLRSLEQRGLDLETYLRLTGQTPEHLRDAVRAEARQSLARELVLEAAADKLGIDASDDEVKELIREEAEAAGEDADEVIEQVWERGRPERLRADLRLRKALDRIAEDVKQIPVDLARARESIWTPEKEKPETGTKLWTPGSKETA